MGRPKKLGCEYFSHDADMYNHRKIKALRQKYGVAGYGIWCMFLEILCASANNEWHSSDEEYELLSGDFGVTVTEIHQVLDYCQQLKLLQNENCFIYSKTMDERLESVWSKRKANGGYGKLKHGTSALYVTEKTQTEANEKVSVTESTQSKVKESKVNKTNKIRGDGEPSPPSKEVKIFHIPILTDVEDYFKEKKTGVWPAEKITAEAHAFMDHYTSNGWKVGRNPMKDWKAAIRNWLKPKQFYEPRTHKNLPVKEIRSTSQLDFQGGPGKL